MIKNSYDSIIPYTTKDGSEIRELLHPDRDGAARTSLAEAAVGPGRETRLHRHLRAEEIYHIAEGEGFLTLGDETIFVRKGDTVLIPPGEPHMVRNSGVAPLRIICCCSPAYSHEDTELM
ncbi:MAG: cupin domain-containing protein [Syntrophales bacterium]|nr:cupin domain-containing protein [Syntrophales bacterium]MDD5233102.1 cupin domain-containing protein [Syntrophales bacterium]MDD5534013.1 cupin domain-containing protein [Syntrophales bacterium]HPL63980.1 cupin domain-containing protein [Syntrophales bacterium]